ERRYGDAARQWTLASCRAWKREADGEPNGGKAYAVMRLLKGIAVGYDAAYDCFTAQERQEIRDTLVSIGGKYYAGYFTTPTIADEHRADSGESNQSIILSPSYGQLDYFAPVLLFLAREYRQPLCQQLAPWDHLLGSIQRTRYITPHGEQLLFELGGYAYVWL